MRDHCVDAACSGFARVTESTLTSTLGQGRMSATNKPRKQPADSAIPTAAKKQARARISNGSQLFFDRIDGRTRVARRYRDLYAAFLSQTGGRNDVMVRTLASMCLQREQMDSAIARGEEVDPLNLIRVCGAISRLMTKLCIVDDLPAEDGTAQAIATITGGEARP